MATGLAVHSLCGSGSPAHGVFGCWSVALLYLQAGAVGALWQCGFGSWWDPLFSPQLCWQMLGRAIGTGCSGCPSSHSLQQLFSAGQSGVTRSLDPSHRSASLFLFIPNCPWPPHHGLVSPGDSSSFPASLCRQLCVWRGALHGAVCVMEPRV